jgi:hypothetical protein
MNRAIKVFLAELVEALFNMGPEGLTDIEVLAGDFNLHGFRISFFATPTLRHGRAKC